MRITQGTFSFLPDFTDEQIDAQIKYALSHGWAMSIEYTDDIHPRNAYWEMWGLPLFDLEAGGLRERPARGSRGPRGLPGALHQADRLRPDLHASDDGALASSSTARRSRSGFKLDRIQGRGRVNSYRLVVEEPSRQSRRAASTSATETPKAPERRSLG